jgi:hypothetical protein
VFALGISDAIVATGLIYRFGGCCERPLTLLFAGLFDFDDIFVVEFVVEVFEAVSFTVLFVGLIAGLPIVVVDLLIAGTEPVFVFLASEGLTIVGVLRDFWVVALQKRVLACVDHLDSELLVQVLVVLLLQLPFDYALTPMSCSLSCIINASEII